MFRGLLVTGLLVAYGVAPASAQVNSNTSSASLTASNAESLTVSVTGGSTVSFTLTPGSTSDGNTPVTISTTWVLSPGMTSVSLYGYFDVPAQALSSGSDAIASSNVLGQVTTGLPTTYTAFTQTNALGPAGGSLRLFNQTINTGNLVGSRSDALALRIDLTSLPNLPAGTYNGTLRLRAQAL